MPAGHVRASRIVSVAVAISPVLVCLLGPPAVGKMSVGQELCRLTGFHGHVVTDVVSPFFSFGSPAFARLTPAWRKTFIEEAFAGGMNLVVTAAWRFDVANDESTVREWLSPYLKHGRVICVELFAPLSVLIERNLSESRRRLKNPYWVTESYLRENLKLHRHQSGGTFPIDVPHIMLDTADMPADVAAQLIVEHFSLTSASET
jgi:hypothetical protein